MKFWTVQSKEVIEIIEKEGIYYPDVKKSRYANYNKIMFSFYSSLLDDYNHVNQSEYSGMVFAFAKFDKFNNHGINHFEDYEDFCDFVELKSDVVGDMWKCFPADCQILEINATNDFNPLYIDFNDFQILMPTPNGNANIFFDPGAEYRDELKEGVRKGRFVYSRYACGLIQAHIPYIKKEDVKGVYPFFAL